MNFLFLPFALYLIDIDVLVSKHALKRGQRAKHKKRDMITLKKSDGSVESNGLFKISFDFL